MYVCMLIYKVRSLINFPGSWVSGFAENSHAQKINKSQKKQAEKMGGQYFAGFITG